MLVGAFIMIVITAIFSSSHPLDFIVNFFATLTGYIFFIVFLCVLAAVVLYYWKLASDDPEKTLAESTKDNLEYSKEVTADISQKAKEFYAEYKERVKEAETEQSDDAPKK